MPENTQKHHYHKKVNMSALDSFIQKHLNALEAFKDESYKDLYKDYSSDELQLLLSTLHNLFTKSYEQLDKYLPTPDYEKNLSEEEANITSLTLSEIKRVQKALEGTEFVSTLSDDCEKILNFYNRILDGNQNAYIPFNTDKFTLNELAPLFIKNNSVGLKSTSGEIYTIVNLIGEGSYATVFKCYDSFYETYFALKRAKHDLNDTELERFKREFDSMHELNSPYVIKAFKFDANSNEYIMEYADKTLYNYIKKNNSKLPVEQRALIIKQILKGFEYIHSRDYLHRDISASNILIKEYDDVIVAKISDLGLLKLPNSQLTSLSTNIKGQLNDPSLSDEGFQNYVIMHETYALTKLIYFILTGKSAISISKIKDPDLRDFVEKGISDNKDNRYSSIAEMREALGFILLK